MIMGLADGVVDIIELDHVAASPTIVHTNGGAGQVVNHVMANYILFADGDENACDLLAKDSTVIDQIVGDGVFYGSGRFVPWIRRSEPTRQMPLSPASVIRLPYTRICRL